MKQELKLVPITEETNLKGRTAYVKVELLGTRDEENNIECLTRWMQGGSTFDQTIEWYLPEDVFILGEDPSTPFYMGDYVCLKEDATTENRAKVIKVDSKRQRILIYNKEKQYIDWEDWSKYVVVKSAKELEAEINYTPYHVTKTTQYVYINNWKENRNTIRFDLNDCKEEDAMKLAEEYCNKLNEQYRKENNL